MLRFPEILKVADETTDRAIRYVRDNLAKVVQEVNRIIAIPAWTEIGSTGAPAFQNSWVNYNATTHTTAGFYKDFTGRVWVKGFLKDGAANSVAFNLPAGYRTGKRTSFVGITESGGASREGHIIIDPGGNVELYDSDGTPAQYSLNGINFMAEQ